MKNEIMKFAIPRPRYICIECWPKAKLRYMASAHEEYVLLPKCRHAGYTGSPKRIQLSDIFYIVVERTNEGLEFRMRRR